MSAPAELPADPASIKKLEKDISKEGKTEEKSMQSILKDMNKQEKSEAKASKVRALSPKILLTSESAVSRL
jgi:hypothetical protein